MNRSEQVPGLRALTKKTSVYLRCYSRLGDYGHSQRNVSGKYNQLFYFPALVPELPPVCFAWIRGISVSFPMISNLTTTG